MLANAVIKGTHFTQHRLVSLANGPGFADAPTHADVIGLVALDLNIIYVNHACQCWYNNS